MVMGNAITTPTSWDDHQGFVFNHVCMSPVSSNETFCKAFECLAVGRSTMDKLYSGVLGFVFFFVLCFSNVHMS